MEGCDQGQVGGCGCDEVGGCDEVEWEDVMRWGGR